MFILAMSEIRLPNVKKTGKILIITCKHGICELPHELPNDLTLRILANLRKYRQSV